MKKILATGAVLSILFSMTAHASTSDIEAAIMDKNYAQAKSLASALLKHEKDSKERIEVEYYLGLSQLRLGQYADAKNAFHIVMSSAGSEDLYDKAALGLIECLHMSGDYQGALKHEEALLNKSPHSSFLSLIYLKMARTNLKLTQWSKAKEYLQKILTDFPQSLEAPIAQNLMEEKEYFAVQVGAFLDKDKAVHLMEELKANGQYAYIIETMTPDNKKFYRVRVGQMTSLSDAQDLETKLSRLGYPTLIYP